MALPLTAILGMMLAVLARADEVPVTVPEVFAPGVISATLNVDAATFTPDGDTVFFDQSYAGASVIVVSHRRDGAWSAPEIAPFSGVWRDLDPAMAPDGSFLVFVSNRPDAGGARPIHAVSFDGHVNAGKGGRLWRVDRRGDGWSDPVRLPDVVNDGTRIYSPSVVADGSVYFQHPDAASRTFHLMRSQYRDGRYLAPVRVVIGPDGADERDPAVAPDESFLVFGANYAGRGAPDRLHIAFRDGDRWGAPVDLGDAVNHDGAEGPHLGPDRRSVYFDSGAEPTLVEWPRTRAQTQADLERARRWDNGNSHIWRLSLAPWLDARRTRAQDGGGGAGVDAKGP